jgi:hypothetical protein
VRADLGGLRRLPVKLGASADAVDRRRGHRVVVATLPDGEPAGWRGWTSPRSAAPKHLAGSLVRVLAELGRRRGASAFRHTIKLGVGLTRVILRETREAGGPPG